MPAALTFPDFRYKYKYVVKCLAVARRRNDAVLALGIVQLASKIEKQDPILSRSQPVRTVTSPRSNHEIKNQTLLLFLST